MRDLLNGGVAIFGRTSSGKLISSGKALANAVVQYGNSGGLIPTRTKKPATTKGPTPTKKPSRAKASVPTEHIHYHKDGTMWAKGQMLAGVPTGYWEWFRKDGTIMRSGHFKNGEQAGEWTTFASTGQSLHVLFLRRLPYRP